MRYRLQLLGAFIAIYFFWGSGYLVTKIALSSIPPFLLSAVRFTLGGTLLYGFSRLIEKERPMPAHWIEATISAILFLVIGSGGIVWAELTAPSGYSALLFATEPLWILLISVLFANGRSTIGLSNVISLFAGLIGVFLLVMPTEESSHSRGDFQSNLVLIISTLSWSLGAIRTQKVKLPISSTLSTGMMMLVGGPILFVCSLVAGEIHAFQFSTVSISSILAVLYLIAFCSILAFNSYLWIIKETSPKLAATYAYVNPLVAVALGWAFAGEVIDSRMILSVLAICLAVILAVYSEVPKRLGTET